MYLDEPVTTDNLPRPGPPLPGGRHQRDHGMDARLVDESGELCDPPHVFGTVGSAETEVAAQALSDFVAVDDAGRNGIGTQADYEGVRQCGLAGAGKSREPPGMRTE